MIEGKLDFLTGLVLFIIYQNRNTTTLLILSMFFCLSGLVRLFKSFIKKEGEV